MAEELEVIDEEKYYGGEGITPKQLILRHIDRISRYIFKGEETPTKDENGNFRTPDRRIVIISAIEFLTSILKPYYDEIMKKEQEKFDKEIAKLEKELLEKAISSEAYKRAINSRKKFYKEYKSWKKWLTTQGIIQIDKTSGHFEFYIAKKFSAYLKLFEQQNHLLYRKNYLAGEEAVEG